ncbi:MAG: alpha/beta hydrolase [Weeksellaceae bacterium]|nr:alpha/beta hydrolase [Weeksellaceae bacterium]
MKLMMCMLSLVLYMYACQVDDVPVVVQDPDLPALNLSNVSYGAQPRHVMDVYLPANRLSAATPVVVLIHGGSWTAGDKADMAGFVPYFQENFPEYAVVNMNYVLATNTSPALPNQVNDVEAVLNYIDEQAAEWQVQPSYVLLGVSAGAHLAMHYSYSRQPNNVAAVVNFVGPNDFLDPNFQNNPLFQYMLGALVDPGAIPAGMNSASYASPVSYVDAASPPTLAFYGTLDNLVPYSQKQRLETAFEPYPGKLSSHGFVGGHTGFLSPQNLSQITTQMHTFMQQITHD